MDNFQDLRFYQLIRMTVQLVIDPAFNGIGLYTNLYNCNKPRVNVNDSIELAQLLYSTYPQSTTDTVYNKRDVFTFSDRR